MKFPGGNIALLPHPEEDRGKALRRVIRSASLTWRLRSDFERKLLHQQIHIGVQPCG